MSSCLPASVPQPLPSSEGLPQSLFSNPIDWVCSPEQAHREVPSRRNLSPPLRKYTLDSVS